MGVQSILIKSTPLSVSEEHQFWLEILEDHARFILDHISPQETQWADEASRYTAVFAGLQAKLDTLSTPPRASAADWIVFAKEVHPAAAGYYKLEGQLLALRLSNRISLNLPPTFLNSTLNENQEYLRLLRYYVQGADAPPLPLWNLMELWLDDQLNHAQLLEKAMDPVELQLAKEAHIIAEDFRSHLIKNRAIHGFLRFSPPDFPAQVEFAREAAETVVRFFKLAGATASKFKQTGMLNSTTLRFLEHQLPETSYFMRKLAAWIPDFPGLVTERLSKDSG
jgi:hypothetical protein